ncbi:hypothetical protein, partial [Ferrimicrobium sp.]|uniref:hypothetical protein n=1 Tax=Ferrimicrobium sp. TaxID=2926050 RepID=UPI00262AB5DD
MELPTETAEPAACPITVQVIIACVLSGHPSLGPVIIRYGRVFSLRYTVLVVASTRSRVLGFIVTVVPKYCCARTEAKRQRGDRCSIYRAA